MASDFEKRHLDIDDISSNLSDDDNRELFTAVIKSIKLESLAEYASNTRKSFSQSNHNESFEVTEIQSPLFGSCHVLYPLQFDDGVRWLLKVPINDTRDKFKDLDAMAIRSEALTMKYIKQRTSIPMPSVFSFSDSCNNELNCPFILMDYIDGKSLYDVWFDKTQPDDIIEARRTRCLQGLAAAMVQLSQFLFEQAGSLIINESNDHVDVGPSRLFDNAAVHKQVEKDEYDGLPIRAAAGPFSDPQKYYSALLDHLKHTKSSYYGGGQLKLLRLLLDLIPEPDPTDGHKPFVLTHPDLDIQNVLVSEDGTLQGIIDWDGVNSSPKCGK